MKSQRGGFVMGLIIGLLAGLALALGVALYVTKVPIPFVNKVPQRTAEDDAAETQKNKNWDPNAPLYGKSPMRSAPAAASAAPPPVIETPPVAATPPAASAPPAVVARPAPARDPAAMLGERAPSPVAAASSATVSTRSSADPFTYLVQAGAYARPEDAEQQRAKLAMMGLDARVTEREQAGRTVFRVRAGPFERKEDAEALKDKLDGSGIETSLVRVQK